MAFQGNRESGQFQVTVKFDVTAKSFEKANSYISEVIGRGWDAIKSDEDAARRNDPKVEIEDRNINYFSTRKIERL